MYYIPTAASTTTTTTIAITHLPVPPNDTDVYSYFQELCYPVLYCSYKYYEYLNNDVIILNTLVWASSS